MMFRRFAACLRVLKSLPLNYEGDLRFDCAYEVAYIGLHRKSLFDRMASNISFASLSVSPEIDDSVTCI